MQFMVLRPMEAVKSPLDPNTERRYEDVAKRLLAVAERELGHAWQADARAAVGVHGNRRSLLGRATWRQYRAALVWYLERSAYAQAASYARSLDESPCLRKSQRTSARKSKRLPEQRLTQLIEHLSVGRGQYDRAIGLWVLSNYYVGLRPEEWWTIEWKEPRLLQVRNAKRSQGRTFGMHRTLALDTFSEQEMHVLHEFLAIVAAHDDAQAFYLACCKRLWKINRKLWPNARRHITLYSGRHQFAADHKAAGLTRDELAALMGHGSNRTADRHYARRQFGRSRSTVSPAAEDVERVRQINDARGATPPEIRERPRS